jgi:hypothetical protein
MEVIRWTDFLEEYKDELEQETKSPGEGHGDHAMKDLFLRVIEHVCCVVSHSLFTCNSSSMVSSPGLKVVTPWNLPWDRRSSSSQFQVKNF